MSGQKECVSYVNGTTILEKNVETLWQPWLKTTPFPPYNVENGHGVSISFQPPNIVWWGWGRYIVWRMVQATNATFFETQYLKKCGNWAESLDKFSSSVPKHFFQDCRYTDVSKKLSRNCCQLWPWCAFTCYINIAFLKDVVFTPSPEKMNEIDWKISQIWPI